MNTIMKMTEAYNYQDFYTSKNSINIVDCQDIEGTRCYLDEAAKKVLTDRISSYNASGIHFIDSGNYHYLSLLWLQKIDFDFNLILFDHHPDNQPPSFGEITSCGGWVLEAQESLPNLKNVYTYGVNEETPITDIPQDLPIYISIDKDILSEEYAKTDWDQGDMTLNSLLDNLKILMDNHTVIGVDICGECGEFPEESSSTNNQTNAIVFDFLSENF